MAEATSSSSTALASKAATVRVVGVALSCGAITVSIWLFGALRRPLTDSCGCETSGKARGLLQVLLRSVGTRFGPTNSGRKVGNCSGGGQGRGGATCCGGGCSVAQHHDGAAGGADVYPSDFMECDHEKAGDLEDLASETHSSRPELLGIGEVFRNLRSRAARSIGLSTELAPTSEADRNLPGRQRVFVKSYGCPHNQSDGEYLAGQLRDYGYTLVDSLDHCDACVVNSCTVKHPSEVRAMNLVSDAQKAGKSVVLAGCVPSSNRKLAETLDGVSMLDVTQLDRIVDVVEETIRGRTVRLMEKRNELPSLSLPKVRKSKLAEIITINAGCLGNCTYCKTKFARGKVVSYPVDDIIARAKVAAAEGACQIELASEDMGAYGLDIGTNIAELLERLSSELPPNVMLRTGMTNPPYIMQHLDRIVHVLNRPNVHAFMHIPVQSGSDQVLQAMRREYTVAEFSRAADRLKAGVPDLFLLTDIICGFPTESEEDWQETMGLCKKYCFQGIHVSQFYARPGTPAAKLKPLKSHIGKDRWRELTAFVTSYDRNEALLGKELRVWFCDTEVEHGQTAGRTKAYAKVLVSRDDSLLGRSAMVRITSTNRIHVEGQILGDVS